MSEIQKIIIDLPKFAITELRAPSLHILSSQQLPEILLALQNIGRSAFRNSSLAGLVKIEQGKLDVKLKRSNKQKHFFLIVGCRKWRI